MRRSLAFLTSILTITMVLSTTASAAVVAVEFADPNLKAVVREAVGNPLGLLRVRDVHALTTLHADLQEITSLEGIQHLVGLKELRLIGNQVDSIEPLLTLENLEVVDLRFNSGLDTSEGSPARSIIDVLVGRGCQVYWGAATVQVEYTPCGGAPRLLCDYDTADAEMLRLIIASITARSQRYHLATTEQTVTLHVTEGLKASSTLDGVFRLTRVSSPSGWHWEKVDDEPWEVAAGSKGIVLLVHGWSSSHEGVAPYGLELAGDGEWTVYAVDYPRDQRISDTGAAIADSLAQCLPPGRKVNILAHSMGGLVARSAIEQHGGAAHVDKLITLGTPHQGLPIEYILNAYELYLQSLAFYDSRIEDPSTSYLLRTALRMGRNSFITATARYKPFGLDALDMVGLTDFLAELNEDSPVETAYYQIAGTEHPPLGEQPSGAVDVVEELYGWFAHAIYNVQLPEAKPTDGVVPLRSALCDLSGEQINAAHVLWDEERAFAFPVHHTSFWESPTVMELVKRLLDPDREEVQ